MALDLQTLLFIVVAGVVIGAIAWTGRRRFPLRIGLGNFFRRKTQVAIVVAGLLIGTAIISSSYVIQSTFDYTIRSAVFHSLDQIDEIVYKSASDGTHVPFNASVYDNLHANLSSMPAIDGLAPRYEFGASVIDNRSDLFEPTATVIGFNASLDLGMFLREDGTSWDGSGLPANGAIMNRVMADDLEARAGDSLVVYVGRGALARPVSFTVAAIVQDEGRGAFGGNPDLFLRLDSVQAAFGGANEINAITVSNLGDAASGYLVTDNADAQLMAHLDPALALTVSNIKADSIRDATQNIDQLSQLFVLLGAFTIIAGILLIINIFVMLAEERKGEMGVARALGMRRAHLVQSFVAEGLLYALLSAAVGAITGLGIAAVILWAFTLIFPPDLFGGVSFVLAWTPLDLVRGFALGFLITMTTIILSAWRVSKLNIVRAIRDIPEPVPHRSTRWQLALGAMLAIAGIVLTVDAFVRQSPLFQDVGPASLAIGIAVLLMRALNPRAVFTGAGAFILVWLLLPSRPVPSTAADISLFVVAGLLLVAGALLVVMFNSEAMLAVATRLVRRRAWRPVVRTAIAYPMNKKFRTGATLASIALIMFTIATMTGIQSMVSSSISTTTYRESGGFDLIAQTNPSIPKTNWSAEFGAAPVSKNLTQSHGLSWVPVRVGFDPGLSGTLYNTSLLGVPTEWANASISLELQAIDPTYATAADAWRALEGNDSFAIIDGTVVPQNFGPSFTTYSAALGDTLYYANPTNPLGPPRHLRIIGILYERFVPGLFVGWNTVRAQFHIDYPSVFYFGVKPGLDITAVAHELDRTFVQYQMLAQNIQTSINQILDVTMGVFNLLEAYLALGLVVGIAGLGVITMRNVVERRTETGALRAIGFRRSMILRSFLLELSFIALTGIAMGDLLGIALSYDLFLRFFADATTFSVPWVRLVLLSSLAFGGAVLSTASPAIRASRMPPAQALRSFE